MTDMISGRIQAGVDALPNSLPHIRSGAVRALAVLSQARTPALPDVPTMGETIPGFEVTAWDGIGAPQGTPPEIVERLNREINAGLADAALLKSRYADVGACRSGRRRPRLARGSQATPRNGKVIRGRLKR